jgi:hypothetical protein
MKVHDIFPFFWDLPLRVFGKHDVYAGMIATILTMVWRALLIGISVVIFLATISENS